MKVTIIPKDAFVAIDGVGYSGVDVSTAPASVHAVQWDGTAGWVEYNSSDDGTKPQNSPIYSLEEFQGVIDSWKLIDAAMKNPPPPTPAELAALVELARAAAYREEADPLFFKSQRGEATTEEWLAKVAEIKARYPKAA